MPVALTCPLCLAVDDAVEGDGTDWGCPQCCREFVFRRCAACGTCSYVGRHLASRSEWRCTWCAQRNGGFRARRDPAEVTAGELASDAVGRDLALSPLRPAVRRGADGLPTEIDGMPTMRAEGTDDRVLNFCTVVGGYGLPFPMGIAAQVGCRAEDVRIQTAAGSLDLAIAGLLQVEIGGSVTRRGGGFVGAGIGLASIVESMVAANILNSLFAKESINSLVGLTAADCCVVLHTSEHPPERLKVFLAPLLGRHAAVKAGAASAEDADPLQRLERLQRLRDQGALSEAEFVALREPTVSALLAGGGDQRPS